MLVLGIETSCDETALALYHTEHGLIDHLVHSQIQNLVKFGGVFPEVAARTHIQYLTPLLNKLLSNNALTLQDLNYIAYTKGPGLIGSLLTGVSFAKALSFGLKIPAIGIHHLEGHLLACFIKELKESTAITQFPEFPFITLLASGGHTMLIQANNLGGYQVLGETLDDAAGEALDKTAKLLGLTVPTGKELACLAATSQTPARFSFPKPLTDHRSPVNLNFSFSGLKTAAMLKLKNLNLMPADPTTLAIKADLAWAFQKAVMDTLVIKCQQALNLTKINQLVIAGGVSANLYLREKLCQLTEAGSGILNPLVSTSPPIKIFLPKLEFCTDNGAMIAVAGAMRAKLGLKDPDLTIQALARWNLASLK